MTDFELQKLVESISTTSFGKLFLHKARFNSRLKTTGGRYLLKSHDIEINPRSLEIHGMDELVGIIKHELCHYHLHLENKGFQHNHIDFKKLLQQVKGNRYCKAMGNKRQARVKYLYKCSVCGVEFQRKRKMNIKKYCCGVCRGTLRLVSKTSIFQQD